MYLNCALFLLGSFTLRTCHCFAVYNEEANINCDGLLNDFTRTRLRDLKQPAATDANKMLFFLHIPRTAGRTFHSCFLRLAHPPSKRCAKSYDVLRLNVSLGHCGLLSSHDDWSVEQYLPPEATMVTQLRDPVSRILSAYEFSVEVAARVLTRSKDYKPDPSRVNTRNVWPWSILIPLIEDDMRKRVASERALAGNDSSVAGNIEDPLDPYNNPLLMPLHEFAVHPVVDDLLSNGAAMQLLGLTQYSHWEEASALRSCVRSSAAIRFKLLKAAQLRLRSLAHVGITEELDLSIATLAASLSISLNTTSWQAMAKQAFSYETDDSVDEGIAAARSKLPGAIATVKAKRRDLAPLTARWKEVRKGLIANKNASMDGNSTKPQPPAWYAEPLKQLTHLQARLDNLTKASRILQSHEATGPSKQVVPDAAFLVEQPLHSVFQRCTESANTRNKHRKTISLAGLVTSGGKRVSFSKQARNKLPADVLQLIRDHNNMDTVLHNEARALLQAKANFHRAAGNLAPLPFPPDSTPQQNLQQRLHQDSSLGGHLTGGKHPGISKPAFDEHDKDEL